MDSAVLTPRPCQGEATFYSLTLLPFMSDLASDQRYGSTSVCCPRCHPGSSAHSSQCWKCPIPDENAMCQTWTTRSTFRGLYAPLRREAYFPVPKVHSAFVHNGSTYILMDRIDGKMLTCGWSSRSAESKTKILTELKRMVDELRSLPPPSQRISDVNGVLYTTADFLVPHLPGHSTLFTTFTFIYAMACKPLQTISQRSSG